MKEETVLTLPVRTKRPATRKAPIVSSPASRKTRSGAAPEPPSELAPDPARESDAQRAMIAELAYFRAERRGFAPGGELQDWLEAEAEVRGRPGG